MASLIQLVKSKKQFSQFFSTFIGISPAVPTFYRPTEKTKVLNKSFKQFLYKFYQQSVLILEEYILTG